MKRRRDKLRAAGLRPVQIWVPDTRASGFTQECSRQARLISEAGTSFGHADDEIWNAASDTTGWTE